MTRNIRLRILIDEEVYIKTINEVSASATDAQLAEFAAKAAKLTTGFLKSLEKIETSEISLY